MTDFKKKIQRAEKTVPAKMKTDKWQKSVEKTDKQLDEALEKLRRDSALDPKILDEPATL